jgi:PAS domain S-box-containing protein
MRLRQGLFTYKYRYTMTFLRKAFLFTLIVLPALLVTAYSYQQIKKNTVNRIYEERRSLASLSARALKEKLDRLYDLGISIATRPSLRKYVSEGKWQEATETLREIPTDFPQVGHVFLADTNGIFIDGVPHVPQIVGKNFSYRDWYKGVKRTAKPYLSEVFRLVANTHIVTALAVPVKNNSGDLTGYLVLQVTTVVLLEWSKEIDVGSSGFLYVIDQNGHIAANPHLAEKDTIIDYSSVPAVQKVLRGEKNVEILYNPIVRETRLTAYEQIPGYGWAVLVQENAATAFADKGSLRFLLMLYIGIILFVLVSAYFIVTEMSRRKKAEVSLRNTVKEVSDYKYALDESAIVAITNENGMITQVNDNFCRISKYTREELIGQNHRIISSGHHPATFFAELWETVNSGKVWKGEIKNKAKDGSVFWLYTTIVPFLDEQGKPYQYIGIHSEITQRKEAEEQLQRMNSELEAFTYSVSHDLRAPLRGIIGFTSMLEEEYAGKLDDEAKRIAAVIKSNTSHMEHLIDDLLSFAKLGRKSIVKSSINTTAMVNEVIDELTRLYKGKPVKWQVHTLPSIHGDSSLLKQVWINLISNAIKYSANKEQPRIEIGSYMQDGQVAFFVKDNGAGFDASYSSKLFKVFQRLHDAHEFEGTGVGLAIVEKIVSRHAGKVWAHGEVNNGACFSFSLPV